MYVLRLWICTKRMCTCFIFRGISRRSCRSFRRISNRRQMTSAEKMMQQMMRPVENGHQSIAPESYPQCTLADWVRAGSLHACRNLCSVCVWACLRVCLRKGLCGSSSALQFAVATLLARSTSRAARSEDVGVTRRWHQERPEFNQGSGGK